MACVCPSVRVCVHVCTLGEADTVDVARVHVSVLQGAPQHRQHVRAVVPCRVLGQKACNTSGPSQARDSGVGRAPHLGRAA
jgi:hypothetical protein